MKKAFVLVLAACFSFLFCVDTFAQTSLPASATIGGPTGVNMVALRVNNKGTLPSDWTTTPVTSLDFNPMTLQTFTVSGRTFSSFLPNHFFAIDMAYTFSTGSPITQIQFHYTDGTPPAGQAHGLGWKATATFVKKRLDANGNEVTETIADRVGPGKILLKDAGTVSFTLSSLSGGWLRVYVGMVTKDPALGTTDIENAPGTQAEVFSPGDVAGSYTGTVSITTL